MTNRQQLCSTIEKIYPEIGSCDVDFKVDYSKEAKAWVVRYEKDGHSLSTHVEDTEAEHCLDGDQCIPLGWQVGQLRVNFEKYIHEHALEDEQ